MSKNQGDRNFDDLSTRFKRTIYETPKGKLRLAALRQDFQDLGIPLNKTEVLDLGGGQGQFSLELAQAGALITLCDISSDMIAEAEKSFSDLGHPLKVFNCPLQDSSSLPSGHFQLVMNHAVLEWLDDPQSGLESICGKVAEGGWLSLMFYNLYGHQWRQLMNGRTHSSIESNLQIRKEGNAPQNPIDYQWVFEELTERGFRILRWRGIRCIHDHMHQKIRERIGQDQVDLADLEYGLQDPFRQLGRYIHVVARKV